MSVSIRVALLCMLTAATIVGQLVTTAHARAESLPLQAVNKANEVIDRAVEAHGGAQALSGLKSIAQHSRYTNYATNQSRIPGPPWDVSYTDIVNAIDYENRRAFTHNQGEGGGFITDFAVYIDGDNSANVDHRRGTVTPVAEPDFDTTTSPFVRVTPTLLVKHLLARRHTSHWLGEAEVDGKPADIVTLVMQVGPALALYIAQDSGLLVKAERVLAPFGQVEYRYSNYRKQDGFAVNQNFKLFVNGEPNLDIKLGPLKLNTSVDAYFKQPEGLVRTPAPGVDELASQKIAEGVYLIGGTGTYALFVDQGDEVVAIGGTAGIPARIELLREQGVEAPIKYGVLTHHHNDHLLGVTPYARAGATLVTHSTHAAVVRAATDQPVKLQTVDNTHTLGTGRNRVVLIDIGPTPHVEHILAAYLPEHKLLFQADHSGFPRTGMLGPAQPVAVALYEAVQKAGLDVQRYVSAHSPRILTGVELSRAVTASSTASALGSE